MTRKPDIAFWFEKDGRYLVKIKSDLTHYDIIVASFDLLSKALEHSNDTLEASWIEEKEDVEEEVSKE